MRASGGAAIALVLGRASPRPPASFRQLEGQRPVRGTPYGQLPATERLPAVAPPLASRKTRPVKGPVRGRQTNTPGGSRCHDGCGRPHAAPCGLSNGREAEATPLPARTIASGGEAIRRPRHKRAAHKAAPMQEQSRRLPIRTSSEAWAAARVAGSVSTRLSLSSSWNAAAPLAAGMSFRTRVVAYSGLGLDLVVAYAS